MKKVYDFLINKIAINKDDVVVVGVSGGPDSMALLFILTLIRKKIPFSIVVGHVNHNVRRESVKEAKFLEDWCMEHDVLFESMKIEKYSDDNFHNEARTIRYTFFENLVKKYNANYLMTAHHGDDLVETVLMRIVRGSTLKGYSGFQSVVDKGTYKIVRPLVFTTKTEIEDFLYKNGVPYVIDKSNFKDKYTRNRYRKHVLPFLKKEDQNVHEKFLKFSRTLYAYSEFLDIQVNKIYHKVYDNKILKLDKFLEFEDLIQEKMIYRILEEIYSDDMMVIHDEHVELIFSLINSKKKNSYIYLPNNIKIIKEYDILKIVDKVEAIDNYEMELENFVVLPNKKHIELVMDCTENGNDICRLSKDEVVFPLYVRTRKHGDKISLHGMNGHKKVKDIFIDKKIPKEERELWPIVVDSKDEVIWIPGIKKSKFIKKKNEKCDIIFKYY